MTEKRCGKSENDREKPGNPENDGEKVRKARE
jgi:hypothetical protein